MKVLFICKKRNDSYGNSIGLMNSAKFVINAIGKMGFHAQLALADDGNSIDRLVTDFNPCLVVIEAVWMHPDKLSELLSIPRHAARKWVVRVHSKTPFLAQEGMAFDWIARYSQHKQVVVAPNSGLLVDDLSHGLGLPRVRLLPNIYDPHDPAEGLVEKLEGWVYNSLKDSVDVGCFGAIRPLKNTAEQAIAAMIFAKKIGRKLRFHINGDRIESKGEEIIKNIRGLFRHTDAELVEHPWMSHKAFIKLVREMDIGLQVSMSESFNIVAADFAANNVPIIVSNDVEWANPLFKADVNSAADISRKMSSAWTMRRVGTTYINKLALDRYNKKATETWREYLKEIERGIA